MSHILYHELTRVAHNMKDDIRIVNRPLTQMAEAARPWFIQLAIDELRRITDRRAEERVRELRRSILGTDLQGGASCGDVICVRPPKLGMAGPAVSTQPPQEAS